MNCLALLGAQVEFELEGLEASERQVALLKTFGDQIVELLAGKVGQIGSWTLILAVGHDYSAGLRSRCSPMCAATICRTWARRNGLLM